MRYRGIVVAITLLFPLAFLPQIIPVGSAASGSCERIVGNWAWFLGGKVTFEAGSYAVWTPPVSSLPPAVGTWHCARTDGTYTVTWQNGFVDTLRLSSDRSRLSGTNSAGVQVWGRRLSTPGSANPVQQRSVAQKASPGAALQAKVQHFLQQGLQALLPNSGTSGQSNTGTSSGSSVCTSLNQNGCWHTLGRGGAGYEQLNQRKGAFR